jgi:hypothetical protein
MAMLRRVHSAFSASTLSMVIKSSRLAEEARAVDSAAGRGAAAREVVD